VRHNNSINILISKFLLTLIVVSLLCFKQSYAEQKQAQLPSQKPEAPTINPDKVKNRIEEINKKLAVVESTENEQTARQLGVQLTRLQEYNANLRKLATIYQRQLTSLKRRASLQKEEKNLGKKLESQQENLIAQPPPYNLSFYDSLLDELSKVKQQEHTISVALKSEKKVLEEGKIKIGEQGQKVREAAEELQKKGQTDKSLHLSWNLEYAKSGEELARAFLNLQRITAENAKTELRLAQLQRKIAQRHVNWVRSKLAFDQDDLDNIIDSLEKRRTSSQTRIDTLRQGQQDVEKDWLKAQKELEEAQVADETVKTKAAAFLEAREAWRETYQKVLEQTETILLILDEEKQFWQFRYSLLKKDVDYESLDSWEKQASDFMKIIERHIKVKEKYHTDLQSEIASIQKQLAYENLDPDVKQYITTHMSALHKMAERGFEYLSLLQGTKSTGQRFLDELNLRQKDITFDKKIKDIGRIAQNIWEIELWVVDERSVTVRKLVIALFILVIGILLTKWFSHSVIRRILLRTQFDKSATVAIEKFIFFFVIVVLLFSVLHTVNIPLTIFTFLGGAIAIGLGFGAHNFINNFISVFILML
jgi:potassium efflux system protein